MPSKRATISTSVAKPSLVGLENAIIHNNLWAILQSLTVLDYFKKKKTSLQIYMIDIEPIGGSIQISFFSSTNLLEPQTRFQIWYSQKSMGKGIIWSTERGKEVSQVLNCLLYSLSILKNPCIPFLPCHPNERTIINTPWKPACK